MTVDSSPSTEFDPRPTFIYCLSCPDTGIPRYVGKTIRSVDYRYRAHLTAGRGGKKFPVSLWVGSLLKNGKRPVVSVLEIVPPGQDWASREIFWIAYYKSPSSLNLDIGGSGGAVGRKVSDEHKKKISAFFKGRKHTPETIARMRGRPPAPKSPEGMAAWKEARKNYRHSAETRQKLSAAGRNRPYRPTYRSPEAVAKHKATMAANKAIGKPRKKKRPDSPATVEKKREIAKARAEARMAQGLPPVGNVGDKRSISSEGRERIRVAKIAYWADRKAAGIPVVGRPHTEKSRAKMSEAKKGKRMPPESRAAQAAKLRGRKQSPEVVAKRMAAIAVSRAAKKAAAAQPATVTQGTLL